MKTLIILHGWQSSKEKWQKVKEEIEKSGIKVIVPDIPGFKPENELQKPWNLNDYVIWLNEFCRQKKVNGELVEPFFLLGHSFGGRMAIKIAAQNQPDQPPQPNQPKLKGIILVSAAGLKKQPSLCDKFWSGFARIIKILKIEKIPILKEIFGFSRKVFYRYVLARTDYLKAQGFLKDTFKNIINEDLSSYLDKISLPTLIIWGGRDKTTPLKDAYLMKEKIKNSKIEILEKVGHTPYLEKPAEVAKLVIKFIKSH